MKEGEEGLVYSLRLGSKKLKYRGDMRENQNEQRTHKAKVENISWS
jgi:hypothetical protein